MITLHRLGHPDADFYVNHDMIVGVEATPDTVIRLMSGDKILVAESPGDVADKVRHCRVDILTMALQMLGEEEAAQEMALRFITGPNLRPVEHPAGPNGQPEQ